MFGGNPIWNADTFLVTPTVRQAAGIAYHVNASGGPFGENRLYT
ncbi:MAG TPA: hypothetical protein VLZ83_05365 [Edaphocola sp.]|nr:hypothetical protein [Edaphocola sp.]